jgi:hypothetical protein
MSPAVCGLFVSLTIVGMSSGIAIPAQAGEAKRTANAYATCGMALKQATIATDVAAKACAEDLHPDELGQCVTAITSTVAPKMDANTVLSACRRVRRPLELATCVNDIHQQDKNANTAAILESCRRSLLPEVHGQCVVGLNHKPLTMNTPSGLSTCIEANDRPTDVLRTFIPIEDLSTIRNFMGVPTPSGTPSSSTPPAASGGNSSGTNTTPQLF